MGLGFEVLEFRQSERVAERTRRPRGWTAGDDPIRYLDYLKTPEWRAVRARFWASRIPKFCGGCDKPWGRGDHLHHRSYRRLGQERLDDLVPLCSGCHEYVHEAVGDRWASLYQVTTNALKRRRAELGLPSRPFHQAP